MDPNKVMMWAQVGGQMVQLVATSIDKIKGALAASGADEAAQNAALDRTHALYQQAIAKEKAIGAGTTHP